MWVHAREASCTLLTEKEQALDSKIQQTEAELDKTIRINLK